MRSMIIKIYKNIYLKLCTSKNEVLHKCPEFSFKTEAVCFTITCQPPEEDLVVFGFCCTWHGGIYQFRPLVLAGHH